MRLEAREPEQRHARQHLALAGDRFAHHDVEGAQAVGGDHQHAVVADRVVVAHLAARERSGSGFRGEVHRATRSAVRMCARLGPPVARSDDPSAPARPLA